MKRKKENLLAKYKYDPTGCLCAQILDVKRSRLSAEYNELCEQITRQHVGSQSREKTLAALLKTGNKLRAIKEVLYEINEAYEKVDDMIKVEINGKPHFRLNINSDRRRSCHGKLRHTEDSARATADEMTERTGDAFNAYQCRHCPHWHVGHSVEGASREGHDESQEA